MAPPLIPERKTKYARPTWHAPHAMLQRARNLKQEIYTVCDASVTAIRMAQQVVQRKIEDEMQRAAAAAAAAALPKVGGCTLRERGESQTEGVYVCAMSRHE